MNRLFALAAAALAISAASCSDARKSVGLAMPEQSSMRWIQDGTNMKKNLEARGYRVFMYYSRDSVSTQQAQIETMVAGKVSCLVIAALDSQALAPLLDKVHLAGIPVISYDRLLRNSPYVDYYATFDNRKVGQLQGQSIVDALDLASPGGGPYNLEIFAGSLDDNNAHYFYSGAMEKLAPYIESGKLIVRSKLTEFGDVATPRWDGPTARKRMETLLGSVYSKTRLDAVLAPNDNIALNILAALKAAGYGQAAGKLPVITGQDSDLQAVRAVMSGEMTSTVFKDTRTLAERVATMVDSILQGKAVEVNDTTTYDNGRITVPAYLCDPVSVTKANCVDVIVGSGYYALDQLK